MSGFRLSIALNNKCVVTVQDISNRHACPTFSPKRRTLAEQTSRRVPLITETTSTPHATPLSCPRQTPIAPKAKLSHLPQPRTQREHTQLLRLENRAELLTRERHLLRYWGRIVLWRSRLFPKDHQLVLQRDKILGQNPCQLPGRETTQEKGSEAR